MSELCVKCKGRGFCGKPCKILARIKKFQPKVNLDFSGSSPPEIFVGYHNYPNLFSGILAPAEMGKTENMSMPELWFQKQASIEDILNSRARMIYSRFTVNIKEKKNKFLDAMQEISLSNKAVDASFELKKKPVMRIDLSSHTAMVGNPAPLKSVKIESNIKVERKVDYLVNDTDVNASKAIEEMYEFGIPVSQIMKILTAGMLGLKTQRKLVPTRWGITAVDDSLSKKMLENIRHYQEISEVLLFHGDYLGNYYEVFFIPGCWSYEVIEISSSGYFGEGVGIGKEKEPATWQDYEFFSGRKEYASSVTGGYYAARLPITEYLEKIKRQATVLVFRDVSEEYWAPCGVGILRELMRGLLKKQPERFNSFEDALKVSINRFHLPIENWTNKSFLLKEIKEQKRLFQF